MAQPNYILYFKEPISGRSNNDENNKYRENVIKNMHTIDDTFYHDIEYGNDWIHFTSNFHKALNLICPSYHSYKIQHKAGRKFNYDYLFTFYNKTQNIISEEKIEFKYNASCIDQAPQFVSPMNPSKYLSQSFEAFHYDNYLKQFLEQNNLPVPERNMYINTVGNDSPDCVKEIQLLYYQGCKQSSKYTGSENAIAFYHKCKDMSKKSITDFINQTDLNIEALSQYLITSQNNKIYLLYKNGLFNIQRTNNDDYIIESYSKDANKNIYKAVTKTGKKMKILLRWKNGNGIAYPAFQIS
jgi:hypothetical protein